MSVDLCEEISFYVDDNNLEAVKDIITKDRSILYCSDRMGRTLLMYANKDDLFDIAKYLVSIGANVNEKDKDGRSPLSFAAQNVAEKITTLLVESGAEVDIEDANGNTPISEIAFNSLSGDVSIADRAKRIMAYLIKNGADMKKKNTHGVSPEDILKYG